MDTPLYTFKKKEEEEEKEEEKDDGQTSLLPEAGKPVSRPKSTFKIGGKPVDDERWQLTLKTLAEYCSQTGQKRQPVTGAGIPSDSAKRIYERLTDYPSLTFEELVSAMRATLSSKWWGTDAPSIGVIFGPRIFEDNLNREMVTSTPVGLRAISELTPGAKEEARRVADGKRPGAREFAVEQGKASEGRLRLHGIELVFESGRLAGWRPVEVDA